jgi:Rieske Fe-S protein
MVCNTVTVLDPSPPMTILDSGATDHYFLSNTNLPNRKPTTEPVQVTVANNQTIYSTHTAELPLPGILWEARTVHLFPAMSNNLIAVTPLTHAGCTIQFKDNQGIISCPNSQAIHCHLSPQGL